MEFRKRIHQNLGLEAAGPLVFVFILNKVQQMTSDALRDMVNDLEKLNLLKEPGQNVETFSEKVADIAKRIDQGITYKPPDLPALVAEKYTNCEVTEFQMTAISVYNEVRRAPSNFHYQDIIDDHVEQYVYLVGAKKWTPLKKGKGKTDEVYALKAQIKALEKKQNVRYMRNNNSYPQNQEFKGLCWDCNQPGHRRGDPKCPKNNQQSNNNNQQRSSNNNNNNRNNNQNSSYNSNSTKPKHTPKHGESHKAEIDGVEWIYCTKCRCWRRKGRGGHFTKDHKS